MIGCEGNTGCEHSRKSQRRLVKSGFLISPYLISRGQPNKPSAADPKSAHARSRTRDAHGVDERGDASVCMLHMPLTFLFVPQAV